jgi:hypothetical protein
MKSRHSREACPVLDTGTGIQKDIARHDFWIPTYVERKKDLETTLLIQSLRVAGWE